jgi:hypothetical protein
MRGGCIITILIVRVGTAEHLHVSIVRLPPLPHINVSVRMIVIIIIRILTTPFLWFFFPASTFRSGVRGGRATRRHWGLHRHRLLVISGPEE